MIIRELFAVGYDDYLVEVETDDNYNIITAIAMQDITESTTFKKGDVIPDSELFDYKSMSDALHFINVSRWDN